MPTDVIMPQMGESIVEGTITKWLKKVGDSVEKDEPLFEISTDKVDAEIPSTVAGVLTEIKFPEGATVEINTVVAVLSENGSRQRPRQLHAMQLRSATVGSPPANGSQQAARQRTSRAASKSSCRRWASRSLKARSPSGSRRSATRSRKTSRSSKSQPTKWMPKFHRPWMACSPRSSARRRRNRSDQRGRRRHRRQRTIHFRRNSRADGAVDRTAAGIAVWRSANDGAGIFGPTAFCGNSAIVTPRPPHCEGTQHRPPTRSRNGVQRPHQQDETSCDLLKMAAEAGMRARKRGQPHRRYRSPRPSPQMLFR